MAQPNTQANDEPVSRSPSINTPPLEHLPQWLLAFGVIAYASGFLILYTFYRRSFDLTDIGTDFFKPQYVHVGLLYFGMFLLVGAPISAIRLRTQRYLGFPLVILVFNILLVFYVFAVFSPPGSAHSGHNWELIISIIMITVLGTSIANILIDRLPLHHRNFYTAVVRWLCVAFVVAIDIYLFLPIAPHIRLDFNSCDAAGGVGIVDLQRLVGAWTEKCVEM